jgi:hypothetical protein
MQISAVNNSMPSRPIEPQAPSSPAFEPPVPVPDPVSMHRVAALLTMLENKPEVRPEVVARGRALAANASYPPPDIITKLAGLIVGDIR